MYLTVQRDKRLNDIVEVGQDVRRGVQLTIELADCSCNRKYSSIRCNVTEMYDFLESSSVHRLVVAPIIRSSATWSLQSFSNDSRAESLRD